MIQIDYYNQAAAYANQGNWAATAQLVELGLGSTPNDARLLGLKALVLTINQRHAEAESFFRRALNADPTNAETHNNFGYMLRMTGQIEDSYEYFSRAVALNENYLEGLRNLAYVAWLTDRYEVARNSFSRYYAFKPDDPKIPFHLAELCLGHGDFPQGWRLYQWRYNRIDKLREYRALDLKYPVSPLPSRLDGKLVVVLPEQGLGDVLFFLRYAPILKARGARIGYGAEAKVRRMIAATGYADELYNEQTILPLLGRSLNICAGDLPFMTGEDNSTPPPVRFSAIPEKVDQARARLAEVGPPPYIGVNWRAGMKAEVDEMRLFKETSPKRLGEVLRDMPGTVLAYQRNPEPGEHASFEEGLGRPCPDFSWIQDDLEVLMGYLAVTDEIVGVSSTSVHLRAAMGLDAKVLFANAVEWRWMLEGEASPWFPGCRVYRVHRKKYIDRELGRLHKELHESLRAKGLR
ncbi:MAG: tetratricopeptide repeat protein [Betaproteobacteria bacterium]